MGLTKPPRPSKTYESETEERIIKARERFEHQPDGFIEIWIREFIRLQNRDGRPVRITDLGIVNTVLRVFDRREAYELGFIPEPTD